LLASLQSVIAFRSNVERGGAPRLSPIRVIQTDDRTERATRDGSPTQHCRAAKKSDRSVCSFGEPVPCGMRAVVLNTVNETRVSLPLGATTSPSGIDSRHVSAVQTAHREIERSNAGDAARRNLQLLAIELNSRRI
jgi:hypothetical protein